MKVGLFRPLYGHIGGYISVYLNTARAPGDPPDALFLRWWAARQRLAAAGAEPKTLDAIEVVVTDPARAAPGRAVFARDGRITFTAPLGAAPRHEIARLGPLPHLMPLLAQRPPSASVLRGAAGRQRERLADGGAGEAGHGHGPRRNRLPRKGAPAGWSPARHQRRPGEAANGAATGPAGGAIETAGGPAAGMLETATGAGGGMFEAATGPAGGAIETATRVHADRDMLAGDVRPRAALLGRPAIPRPARAGQAGQEVAAAGRVVARTAEHSVSALADRECRARFGEWQARRAHSGTVEGMTATLLALRDGRLASLFLADRPASPAVVWIGPDGADLASSPGELRERGVRAPVTERADAAIVRALAAADAELHILPEDVLVPGGQDTGHSGITFPVDGICGTLRWGEAS